MWVPVRMASPIKYTDSYILTAPLCLLTALSAALHVVLGECHQKRVKITHLSRLADDPEKSKFVTSISCNCQFLPKV